ncbi:unnamed protein product [Pocillopora meandrina]|uniref:Uncharacterized protein n=1 Tax=Pocillopora meandrina TaxID=46732 RepID=A0AAU9Y5V5_9CNID|nr:unnamed protein product [Pocillopora meandrina]
MTISAGLNLTGRTHVLSSTKGNETCIRTTVMPPNSTNTTTPAPAVICYNETTPVVPHVFCNTTVDDNLCKPYLNLSQKGQRPTPKQFDKFLPFISRTTQRQNAPKGKEFKLALK